MNIRENEFILKNFRNITILNPGKKDNLDQKLCCNRKKY